MCRYRTESELDKVKIRLTEDAKVSPISPPTVYFARPPSLDGMFRCHHRVVPATQAKPPLAILHRLVGGCQGVPKKKKGKRIRTVYWSKRGGVWVFSNGM